MSKVHIQNQKAVDGGWEFEVRVEGQQFEVFVDKDYYCQLTAESIEPEELVEESFVFLLERESVDAILSEFNLRKIQTYFPEYESDMRESFG